MSEAEAAPPTEAPAEEAPAAAEPEAKKEPAALKMWKAAEKPAYEKMPPNTPRKPVAIPVENPTELSREQLSSKFKN